MRSTHTERHATERIGWLRAAVLGANDGILSTASLVVGVASAGTDRDGVLLAGAAGLIAGAMSMAAGEYVSVSSQADAEKSDLGRERLELAQSPAMEREELAQIYVSRGLDPDLARQVADQLTAHDALGAHARDELGITELTSAKPLQAAMTSALTFACGAAMPLLATVAAPGHLISPVVSAASVAFLVLLGFLGARAARSDVVRSVLRVTFWGVAAMAATALVGRLFGATIA
jgi:VIT1/CCC1 family predicted Fe2+/Mn2+ transporter